VYKFVFGYNNIENNIVNNIVYKFVPCIVILSYCHIVIIVTILFILSDIVDKIVVSMNKFVTILETILSTNLYTTAAAPNLLNRSS
jgi:hypothetical protein